MWSMPPFLDFLDFLDFLKCESQTVQESAGFMQVLFPALLLMHMLFSNIVIDA